MVGCILYIAAIELLAFPLGRLVPKSWFLPDRFPFRTYAAEEGLYTRLKVRRWQKKLPDMSRIFPTLMPPKNLSGDFAELLPLMIAETCVAELTHALLALAGFFCLALWQGTGGLLFSLGCLAANLPYVVIQRYNRPRLMRLLSTMPKREKTTENKTTAEKNLRLNPEENQ